MPARSAAPSRERDLDYSNPGVIGRRTGVTLAPRKLDEYGLEEMSGLFSSPKKPSPVNKRTIMESVEEVPGEETPRVRDGSHPQSETPGTVASRRSNRTPRRIPRSASPRKSGITGTARRNGALDVLAQKQLQQEVEQAQEAEAIQDQSQPDESQLSATPVQTAHPQVASARPATIATRRFSPERTPLRNKVLNRATKSAFVGRVSDVHSILQDEPLQNEQPEETPSHVQLSTIAPETGMDDDDDDDGNVIVLGNMEDDEQHTLPEADQELPDLPVAPVIEQDDEDEDETFEPPARTTNRRGQQNKANSRRKRKSDALEEAEAAAVVSSPTVKRAKRKSNESSASIQKRREGIAGQETSQPSQKRRGRKPLQNKSTNTKLSANQQKEVNDVVEKIKARPGQKRSLYILRRETPADDTATHTRSGRISIKPLAYWRNEHCVYSSDSPNRGLADGARFPLDSIKEIIRHEEAPPPTRPSKKPKSKRRSKTQEQQDDESDLDLDGGEDVVDPDADDWELDTGTLKGTVAVWDPDTQAPNGDEEENEIAHAAAAIQTKDVKGSSFKYAKLLSTRFFGTGIVDLPPGGIKKPKNSRKMHMSFFVFQGRVTVEIGPLNATETRFSVGKGGFWQVPRGNQYSIENEHGKTARIFFSQACEPVPEGMMEE